MTYNLLDNFLQENSIAFIKDEPLSAHTTFKIGGNADRFVTVNNENELSRLLVYLCENSIRYFIIGRGSNLLASDDGFRGVIISLGGDFRNISVLNEKPDGVVEIVCGAGASLSSLCAFARDNSLTGLEFAWGIPGSVGGACFMNAGAYGGEMKDVLSSVKHINSDGSFGTYSGDNLDLSYRHSVYSGTDKIITQAVLFLKNGDKADISAKMDDLMNRRKSKQPLEYPSAGSTFKRPAGYFAAALIEECGLKGVHVGDACVSEKHSGFVVNKGKASCRDVLDLIDVVKSEVKKQKDVNLELEVICLE